MNERLVRVAEIPKRTESQNKTEWQHWSKVRKKRKMWARLARVYVGLPDLEPKTKRRVKITRYSSGTLDQGNFIGGCKALIDSLVDLGWIVDDSPKWVTIEYCQEKKRNGDSTGIEIYEPTEAQPQERE